MISTEGLDVRAPGDYRTEAPVPSAIAGGGGTSSGMVLTELSLKPIYANDAALRVLEYATEPRQPAEWQARCQTRLREIVKASEYTPEMAPVMSFVSGRRRYVCRSFLLNGHRADTRPIVALLIERSAPESRLAEASRRFHLSPREYETVCHLVHGLTTKEIAARMNVSPNTIKQFIRLTMSKMNVTTRSGILGKLLSPLDAHHPPSKPD